jgi:hypothetical protein
MPYQVTEKDLDFLKPCAEANWEPFLARLDPKVKWWISDDETNVETAAGIWVRVLADVKTG